MKKLTILVIFLISFFIYFQKEKDSDYMIKSKISVTTYINRIGNLDDYTENVVIYKLVDKKYIKYIQIFK